MKLSQLNIIELVSLCNGTEKLIEHLATHIKINNAIQSNRLNNLNKNYLNIRDKYDKILDELNKRVTEIEDE